MTSGCRAVVFMGDRLQRHIQHILPARCIGIVRVARAFPLSVLKPPTVSYVLLCAGSLDASSPSLYEHARIGSSIDPGVLQTGAKRSG
jgi:hypothetical protein